MCSVPLKAIGSNWQAISTTAQLPPEIYPKNCFQFGYHLVTSERQFTYGQQFQFFLYASRKELTSCSSILSCGLKCITLNLLVVTTHVGHSNKNPYLNSHGFIFPLNSFRKQLNSHSSTPLKPWVCTPYQSHCTLQMFNHFLIKIDLHIVKQQSSSKFLQEAVDEPFQHTSETLTMHFIPITFYSTNINHYLIKIDLHIVK